MDSTSDSESAKGRYSRLARSREPFLERARECSKLTIPTLIPEEGTGAHTEFPTPYQGLGAQGLNHLTNKCVMALFPPNQPFFRYGVDDFTLQEFEAQNRRAEIEKELASYERALQMSMEHAMLRPVIHRSLRHAIVGGNGLITIDPDSDNLEAVFYPLSRYVVRRDTAGNVLEVISVDYLAAETVPSDLLSEAEDSSSAHSNSEEKTKELYTHYYRTSNEWEYYQELDGKGIESTFGTAPLDVPPFIAMRWNAVDGEDYGRGYVEEYLGDLQTVENLSEAILDGAAVASRHITLVSPNSAIDPQEFESAENGAVIEGEPESVQMFRAEKFGDYQTVNQTLDRVQQRLAAAFLLHSAVQRDAERVTAEEVRYMAQELEMALGGVYTLLSKEFQLPLVKIVERWKQVRGELPDLPEDAVAPTITAGIDALGRGHDLQKLTTFFRLAQEMLGDSLGQFIHPNDALKRLGNALGIEMDGMVKTEEEIQAEQQQAMLMQMAQQGLSPGIQAAGQLGTEAMRQDNNGPT